MSFRVKKSEKKTWKIVILFVGIWNLPVTVESPCASYPIYYSQIEKRSDLCWPFGKKCEFHTCYAARSSPISTCIYLLLSFCCNFTTTTSTDTRHPANFYAMQSHVLAQSRASKHRRNLSPRNARTSLLGALKIFPESAQQQSSREGRTKTNVKAAAPDASRGRKKKRKI